MVRPRPYRELFEDDLMDVRFTNPRDRLPRDHSDFVRAIVIDRPFNALHKVARYSEIVLAKVRAQIPESTLVVSEVENLFFEVRSVMRDVLSEDQGKGEFKRLWVDGVRERARTMLDLALAVDRTVVAATSWCECPACRGAGRLRSSEADHVRAALKSHPRDEIPELRVDK